MRLLKINLSPHYVLRSLAGWRKNILLLFELFRQFVSSKKDFYLKRSNNSEQKLSDFIDVEFTIIKYITLKYL